MISRNDTRIHNLLIKIERKKSTGIMSHIQINVLTPSSHIASQNRYIYILHYTKVYCISPRWRWVCMYSFSWNVFHRKLDKMTVFLSWSNSTGWRSVAVWIRTGLNTLNRLLCIPNVSTAQTSHEDVIDLARLHRRCPSIHYKPF